MKKLLATTSLALLLAAGCVKDGGADGKGATGLADEPVASARGTVIGRAEFEKAVNEAYGLNVLIYLVQVQLVRQHAAEQHVTVTPEDIAAEHLRMAKAILPAAEPKNYEAELEKFFRTNRGKAEVELLTEINATLRKLADAQLAGKITDEQVRQAYWVLYGARVKVRHIQCSNMQEVGEALRRLKTESFEAVASSMSANPHTRKLGGELPSFTQNSPDVPEAFRKMAFLLKDGEVSEPVHADGAYHIIKMVEHIEPKAIAFETVKDTVREQMYAQASEGARKELLQKLMSETEQTLTIHDPLMARQYAKMKEHRAGALSDQDEIRRQMDAERAKLATQPTTAGTQPASSPTTGTTMPLAPATNSTEPLRPPATLPGH